MQSIAHKYVDWVVAIDCFYLQKMGLKEIGRAL